MFPPCPTHFGFGVQEVDCDEACQEPVRSVPVSLVLTAEDRNDQNTVVDDVVFPSQGFEGDRVDL